MTLVNLSSQERHQLLAVLQELDPSAPAEKRRTYRRKILMTLWIRRVGKYYGRGVFKALVFNISSTGVGLYCRGALQRGDRFVLPLRFREKSNNTWLVLCRVQNTRKLESGEFQIGARFIDRIEAASIDSKLPGDWRL